MAEITFLAPGSCQLEVTAQGNVGTDTGVDLASVSWTIEQALIAGCRFSPSAGDVHIDRNGVLTIGRSLFDRINQADGDENIPGQCTLVIRADSTITDNVLDRFKVLVGYPGEGGGGGGSSDFTTATISLTLPNSNLLSVEFPLVNDDETGSFAMNGSVSQTGNIDMLLYKGACLVNVVLDESADPAQYSFESSGDIESVTEPGTYMATGDCSITVTVV